MRGGAVAILCILIEARPEGEDPQQPEKEYTVLTLQARVPVARNNFPEIPAGMLDGTNEFKGKAQEEMYEETGLKIQGNYLLDLTGLAYNVREEHQKQHATTTTTNVSAHPAEAVAPHYEGMYPSAGGCDEFIRLFVYRCRMHKRHIELMKKAHTGVGHEIITLKIIPLEDLWKEAPDSKALSALYLYEKMVKGNKEYDSYICPLETQQDELEARLTMTAEARQQERKAKDKQRQAPSAGPAPKKG